MYGARCARCGASGQLHVDHIYPVKHGGSNELSNLQLLCRTCNLKKGAKRYRKRPACCRLRTPVVGQAA
jgi:5-methylcytosine-specific restriction endonuclease McrA